LFLHELEDAIRDWICDVHHPFDHDGLAVADWPNLVVSPNEMFAIGIAKAGRHYSGWYWSATTDAHVVHESRLSSLDPLAVRVDTFAE
jgi:hypothetical protein